MMGFQELGGYGMDNLDRDGGRYMGNEGIE
jgi:hypothetical protein